MGGMMKKLLQKFSFLKFSKQPKQDGNILAVAMILSSIMMGFSLFAGKIMREDINHTYNIISTEKAYFSAEAGLENGLLSLQKEPLQDKQEDEKELDNGAFYQISLISQYEEIPVKIEPKQKIRINLKRLKKGSDNAIIEEKITNFTLEEISQENSADSPAIDWSVSCENSSLNPANASNGGALLSKVIGGTFSQENFTTEKEGKSTSIDGIGNDGKFKYNKSSVKSFINKNENTNCWLSLKNTGVNLISLVYKASASEKITAPETLIKSTGQSGNAKKVIKFNKPQKALIDWF
jgi:hypothetical protein